MARPDSRNGGARVTDEERREVAHRMREFDVSEFKESAIVPFLECLGIGYVNWRGVLDMLADLIDRPTCYVVEHKTHCGSYGCEEAGQLWVLSCGDECVNDSDFPPSYCPECGARVTEVVRDGD